MSAARSIYARLTARYNGRTPTPAKLLGRRSRGDACGRGPVALQGRVPAGTSPSGSPTASLVLEDLDSLPDEDVAANLIEVKGIGQWTVDMFLIFHLGRPDVLPVGDLGIRRAAMLRYRLRKLPEPKRLTTLARPWRPWRSVASWYLLGFTAAQCPRRSARTAALSARAPGPGSASCAPPAARDRTCAGGPASTTIPSSMNTTLVGDVARESHLVRDDHHRHALGGELAHHVEHLLDELRVERARDLVEQHHVRVHRERARDRDALLLTARQPLGILVHLVREPDALEQRAALGARLLRGAAEHRPCASETLSIARLVREQVELLEHHADAAAHEVDLCPACCR